jgi:Zn-dependent protease with chaperone function
MVHHHMLWYLALVIGLSLMLGVAASLLDPLLPSHATHPNLSYVIGVGIQIAFFGLLGWVFVKLSQRCERQADVYGARTVEAITLAEHVNQPAPPAELMGVGQAGAAAMSSALLRVAQINGMSIDTHDPIHGSIRSRIDFLTAISSDPAHTRSYDAGMRWIFLGVAVLLVSSVAAAWATGSTGA